SAYTARGLPSCSAAVTAACDLSWEDRPRLFDHTFSGLSPVLTEAGAEPAGPAFALYTRQPSETVDLQVGIAISKGLTRAEPIAHGLLVIPSELPAGSMAVRSHIGGYDGLEQAWA